MFAGNIRVTLFTQSSFTSRARVDTWSYPPFFQASPCHSLQKIRAPLDNAGAQRSIHIIWKDKRQLCTTPRADSIRIIHPFLSNNPCHILLYPSRPSCMLFAEIPPRLCRPAIFFRFLFFWSSGSRFPAHVRLRPDDPLSSSQSCPSSIPNCWVKGRE